MAPVGAVGGEGDVGAAEGEPLSRHELRPACEDVVVGFEDEASQVGRGDDDGGHSSEAEVDDRAQLVGQFGEGTVGRDVGEEEVVKVTDYWESWWGWWGTR